MKFSIQLSNNAGMTLMTIGEQRPLFPNGREIRLNWFSQIIHKWVLKNADQAC
ncbi:hypothetical protein [Lentilactobacillus parafarraginis]|uniref:hypothetical protein n=1 Tax=Lentilactobacillus parafarraginis TaxID=390842 RepID=UPI001C65AEB9|nr:hypothetical protein [Lentilactobacillus parafarraginis]